jgi:hypothetical protein
VFAKRGVPSLYFHKGAHDEARPADAPTAIDAEQAARIFRLAFYIGQAIANVEAPPRWSAAGRQELIQSERKE